MSLVLDYIPLAANLFGLLTLYLIWARQEITDALAKVPIVFAAFIIIFSFEFFIFGPFSFIGKETDSYNAARFFYLANIYDGNGFAQEIGGGHDASLLFDSVIFSLGRTLFGLFPPWLAILSYKIIIGALGFFGSFLLTRKAGADQRIALVLACIYPVSNIYLLNFSLEFETGFSAIPLAVYACITYHKPLRWWCLVIFSAAVLALAQPMKVFPAFLVAVVGGWILLGGSPKRLLFGIAIHILTSFVNWFKVLESLRQLVGVTSRGMEYTTHILSPLDILESTIQLFLLYPAATAGILAAIFFTLYQRNSFFSKIFLALAWFSAAYILAKSIPWQHLGFGFLNRVEHSYMRLALGTIAIMSLAKSFAFKGNPSLKDFKQKIISLQKFNNKLPIILVSIALAFHANSKLTNAAQWIAFGGQSSVFGFQDLYNPPWKSDQLYRVVSIADAPHPNVIGGVYGLETLDASIQLNPYAWNTFWRVIKRESFESERTATRPSLNWQYWDGLNYNIDNALDVELLAIANVRHIISPFPLLSKRAKEVVRPSQNSWAINKFDTTSSYLGFIKNGIKRIFNPGKHFIYEVSSALPRIYPATKVIVSKKECDQKCFFDLVRTYAPSGGIVLKKTDSTLSPPNSLLEILDIKKIKGGYRIELNAPKGGILVINQSSVLGWTAQAGISNRLLSIVSANGIQMAINIPPKTKILKLRYRTENLN